MGKYTYTGPGGGSFQGNTPGPPTGTVYPFKISTNTTNSPAVSKPAQQKELFSYKIPLFGPNAASFYGLIIPVSFGRRAIVGVPIFASQVYADSHGNPVVDFAVSLGYEMAQADELVDVQVLRIWADGTLIYDCFASTGWNVASNIKFKVYKGTEDQLPDPTLVKWLTAANGIAFRGQVYIMFTGYPIPADAAYAVPVIRAEVRDAYSTAANVIDMPRLSGGAAYAPIGITSTVDWTRQKVYVHDLTSNIVRVSDLFTLAEVNQFSVDVNTAVFNGAFYVEPQYGYLITCAGASNSTPTLALDPVSGAQVGSFGVTGAFLANTSGHFVTSYWYSETAANNQTMTDAFIVCIGFFAGTLGILHLDPDGTLDYVWIPGAANTVHDDYASLTGSLTRACPGDVIPFEDAATAFCSTSGELTRLVVTRSGIGGWQVRHDIVWRPPSSHRIEHMFTSPVEDDIIVITKNTVSSEWFFSRVHLNDNLRQKSNPDPGTSGATSYATALWTAGPIYPLNDSSVVSRAFDNSQWGSTHTIGYPVPGLHTMTVLDVQTGTWGTFDLSTWTLDGAARTGNIPLSTFTTWNGDAEYIIGWSSPGATGGGFGPAKITPITPPTGGIPLYTILRWMMQYAGFETSELSVSTDLTDTFTGGIVQELNLNLWDMLDQMSKAFQFDVFESEGKVKFTRVLRGASLSISVTLDPDNDLLAYNASDAEGKGNNENTSGQASSYAAFTTERNWNTDAPGTIELHYLDETQEYTVNIARAKKTTFPVRTTENDNVQIIGVPIIMTPAVAMVYAARALYDLYAGQVFHNLRLGPKYLRLEPGDVVALTINDMDYVIKVTEGTINADYSMSVRAQGFANINVSLTGEDALNLGGQTVAGPSLTQAFIIDTPPLLPADCAALNDSLLRTYAEVASYGQSGWLGGSLLFSTAIAGPYSEVVRDTVTGGTYAGVAGSALSGACGYATDFVSSLPVTFTLLPAALSGSTGFLLVGKTGRWEFMSYESAVLATGNSRQYTFSTLTRGLRGTEWHTRDHAAGDSVLVYPNVQHMKLLTLDATLLSGTIYAKNPGINQDANTMPVRSFTEVGNFEKPWAPTSLKALTVSGGSSAITLSWMRRTRLEYNPLGVSGSVQPLEPGWTEQYEIEILGTTGNILRTVTGALTTSYTYASGDVTTDFGGVPATLSFNVYQISPVVGRGFVGSITTDVVSAT